MCCSSIEMRLDDMSEHSPKAQNIREHQNTQ